MIDFAPTPDQESMLDAVARFLAQRLPIDEVRRRDREHVPPYDLLPELGALGVLGLPFPEQYGGMASSWMTLALVQERMARHAYFAGSIVSRVVAFGGMTLLAYGSEAQRREWLPRLAAGNALFALALSEADAGSDAAAIRTRAVRGTSGWLLNGRKTWISDARGAQQLVVAARSDPSTFGAKGISTFLVARDSPGISMTELPKLGNHCMPSFDIGFDDVEITDDALLGVEGAGFRQLMSTLHYSRASMAATTTGCAQAAVDLAIAHAKARMQFGRPLGANQTIRHRLADMQMRVDQSRLIVRHLAWLIAEGRPCRREAAQAKVIATEALQFVTHHGMQILASAAYAADSDLQRMWRDARLYSFGEGANEIQRDLIARELGL
ncbi:MAG: acyl-CoA dehydrogenase family protein [Burkholderiales bacterium]